MWDLRIAHNMGRTGRDGKVRPHGDADDLAAWLPFHERGAILPRQSRILPGVMVVPFGTRRPTVTANVGGVLVGSAHPVVVQSMTNTDTADAASTAAQVAALARAGSQLVRVTVNNDEAAAAVPEIVRRLGDEGVDVPIVGDFHYNGHLLLTRHEECARALAKYRINPGNVGGKRRDEHFRTIVQVAVDHGKPVRIGVNWGSLDQDLLTVMMDENARAGSPRDARDVYIEAMLASAPNPASRPDQTRRFISVLSVIVAGIQSEWIASVRPRSRVQDAPSPTPPGLGKSSPRSTSWIVRALRRSAGRSRRSTR